MINASRNLEISILPAHLDDLNAIMLVEQSGFPAAEQWSERSWRGELLGEHRTILIARAQHPIGVISMKIIGEWSDSAILKKRDTLPFRMRKRYLRRSTSKNGL